MTTPITFLRLLATALLGIVLTSCGSNEQKYYLLSAAGPAPATQGPGIGVGPVTVAEYLDRPNLVFQGTANTLEINDLHQWAGELQKDFANVLATNLGRRKGTGSLQTYPWPRDSEVRWQISVDVTRFHGTANGEAILQTSWRVYDLSDSRVIHSQTSNFSEPLGADGFNALAAAQSRLVDRLAAVIAPWLK